MAFSDFKQLLDDVDDLLMSLISIFAKHAGV